MTDSAPAATTPPPVQRLWDFFIAHAGGDASAAELLYSNLHKRARTFLDSKCLKPGDDWTVELPRAQQASRVTVVLVSCNTEGAYYQREEIAAAIDAVRRRPGEHRVVPVYLDLGSTERPDVPYGLRIRHGIVLRPGDELAAVATRLLDTLQDPEDSNDSATDSIDLLHAAVTGFAGCTERGPVNGPVRVTSYAEFVAIFGPPVDPGRSFLGYAVRGFFENGGQQACIARVVPRDAAIAAIQIGTDDGDPCLVVRARDPGGWGNRLRIEISEGARIGVRLAVSMAHPDTDQLELVEDYDNLSLDPRGPNFLIAEVEARTNLIQVEWLGAPERRPRYGTWILAGGMDGSVADAQDYGGGANLVACQRGLGALDAFADIALLCVPDCSHPSLPAAERIRLLAAVVAKCEQRGEQLAILAPGPGELDPKAPGDSAHAAVYAPWIRIGDTNGGEPVLIPPVGHVAGAYAYRDAERGLCSPLTALVIRGLAPGTGANTPMETAFDPAQADRLVRRGVNPLRAADVLGTAIVETAISTALETRLQPIHLVRQVGFLRRTLTYGSLWMVFEPSTAETHKRLVEQITEFLQTLWHRGMLTGTSAAEAFFVRCDDTTMTEEDRANDRTICVVGVSLADPPISIYLVLTFSDGVAESRWLT